jgi:hypothetical protein
MGDVVYDTGIITKLDLPVDRMLKFALDKVKLESVVILGWQDDGEPYFASSVADAAEVVFLLELYKFQLIEMVAKGKAVENPPDASA